MDKTLFVERAKTYLTMLSEGVHPVSGQAIPQDSVFMDEKVKRCFSFIVETLDEYLSLVDRVNELEEGGRALSAGKKTAFSVTQEQCDAIKLSAKPITMTSFMRNVNSVIDRKSMTRLTSYRVNKWLAERGIFSASSVETLVRKTVYAPSEAAGKFGITEDRTVDPITGEVKSQIVLGEKAQLFIIENLAEIARSI